MNIKGCLHKVVRAAGRGTWGYIRLPILLRVRARISQLEDFANKRKASECNQMWWFFYLFVNQYNDVLHCYVAGILMFL